MARLFFALWPGAAAASSLEQVALALADLVQGKPVPAPKIHLTLAFLGALSPAETESALAIGASLRASAFDVRLDQVGSFRKARVAWAGCSQVPDALASCQSRLEARLREAGFDLEERPFAPHVTLARRIAKPVPLAAMPPVEWRARELTLARSETGTGRYAILESWSLG